MTRACTFFPTAFSVIFHIAPGMEDDWPFGLSLLLHFEAMINFNGSAVQLSHRFDELGKGIFRCDWNVFIVSPLS